MLDGAQVPYPPFTSDFQFEVELVIAIGRAGRDIAVADARDHIWGYAVGIDLTRRDRQRDARDLRLPWEVGKSFDASAPCGTIAPARRCRGISRAAPIIAFGKWHRAPARRSSGR